MTSMSCNRLMKIYLSDMMNELNFLMDEILHIAYIYNFFSAKKEGNEAEKTFLLEGRTLRHFFRTIHPILSEISNDLMDMYFYYKKAQNLLKTELHSGKDEERERALVKEDIDFFQAINNYIQTKQKLLEKLVFLQRKIISILNSFPFYYPSPKVSSIKEASKIHLFIELLAQDIYDVFVDEFNLPRGSFPKGAYFYWDYDPELKFLDKSNLFIFNSNFFLPEKQSYWIILFHEVFHFMLNRAREQTYNQDDKKKHSGGERFLDELLRYIDRCIETLYARFPLISSRANISKETITDIFIDSILTYMFGKEFFIPAFSNIYLFDEESFLFPRGDRTWYIRLRVLTDVLQEFHDKYTNEKELPTGGVSIHSEEILSVYRKAQYETKYVKIALFSHMEKIIKVIEEFCKRFISQQSDYLSYLKDKLIGRKWIKTYTEAQTYFINSKWKNPNLDIEGRVFCYKLNRNLIGLDDKEEDSLKNLEVINFKYIKCRHDSKKKLCDYLDVFHALGYGAYTGLYIIGNFHQKLNRLEGEAVTYVFRSLHKLGLISNDSIKYLETNQVFDETTNIELRLVIDNFPFYKKDYVLTHIYGERLKLTNNEQAEAGKKVYIFVKSLINPHASEEQGQSLYSKVKDLFNKFCQEISPYLVNCSVQIHHFISFDWFDLATLIIISKDSNGCEIDLRKVLKELKCKVLVNNKIEGSDTPLLLRTETDIFIGRDILDDVIIPKGSIHLRVSSKYLGETSNYLNDLKKKIEDDVSLGKWKITLRFGIRDLMLHPEEVDDEGWRFKDILKKICGVLELKDGEFFSDFQFVVSIEADCEE